MNQKIVAACVMALGVLGVQSAEAVLVTITGGVGAGTVVFDSQGFEVGQTPGNLPTPNATIVAAARPGVADWEVHNTGASAGIYIEDGAATARNGRAGPTGPAGGNNYLAIDRSNASFAASPANANTYVNASFSQDINPQLSSFTMTTAFWMNAAAGATTSTNEPTQNFTFTFTTDSLNSANDNAQLAGIGFRFNNLTTTSTADDVPVVYQWNQATAGSGSPASTDYAPTAITWTPGQWNNVTFAWDHVNAIGSLNVNGQVVAVNKTPFSGVPSAIGQIHFRTNAGQNVTAYLDAVVAVPEPMTLGVLGIAGTMGLARRRAR